MGKKLVVYVDDSPSGILWNLPRNGDAVVSATKSAIYNRRATITFASPPRKVNRKGKR